MIDAHQRLTELHRDREAPACPWQENSDECRRTAAEADREWQEAGRRFDAIHAKIMTRARISELVIGALGGPWDLRAEKALRDALAGILEENFGVKVLSTDEYDDSGEVYGRPEQVELDIINSNGRLILCELKLWVYKAGMYIFERKARFYEKRHRCQADRLIVIAPMIDPGALKVAQDLGIEVYDDATDVEAL